MHCSELNDRFPNLTYFASRVTLALCSLPFALSRIERTLYSSASTIEHMRINHRCAHVFVAKQFLDRSDIVSVFEQVCGEAVTKCMTGPMLINARLSNCSLDRAMHAVF